MESLATSPHLAVAAVLLSVTTLFALAGIAGVAHVRWRARAARRSAADDRRADALRAVALPPVSVIKPLCGADDALEDNLRTFFVQDHPDYELVFAIVGADDPARDVVEALRREYPDVRARVVVHRGARGLNPKVANVRGAVDSVRHDVVLISDSNVAVHPGYVREMAHELASDERVGLVTSLFAGVDDQTLGAALDNAQLNGHIANAITASHAAGHPCVVGKSMMFRRSDFAALGGFESVASVLAEDYIIGRMYHEAGWEVRLAPHVIHNVNQRTSVRGFYGRHKRWLMMRARLNPLAWAAEPLGMPLVSALVAVAIGAPAAPTLALGAAILFARDGAQTLLLRGPRGLLRALAVTPLREAIMFWAWLQAPIRRHVSWRGKRVRISAGSRLFSTR